MKTNEERLQDLFSYLENLSHVKADEIPDIDLYMDQVTTFMDSHLKDMRRHPGDKVLTKTMINNYAKNMNCSISGVSSSATCIVSR